MDSTYLKTRRDRLHCNCASGLHTTPVSIDSDRERVTQSDCSEKHLHTNKEILVGCRYRAGRNRAMHCVVTAMTAKNRRRVFDEAVFLHNGQKDALPKGQENHRFDREEFPHWIKRLQQVFRCEVEQHETVEGERYREVVDNGDIKIGGVSSPIAIAILSKWLQYENDKAHERLDCAELQCGLFAESEETDRVRSTLKAAGPIPEGGLDGLTTDLRHDIALPS